MCSDRWRRLVAAAVVGLCGWAVVGPAHATIFFAKDEALELAFPDGDRRVAKDVFLTADERRAVEQLARAPLDSQLVTIYVGYSRDHIVGYAIFDTHAVRTAHETLMTVVSPEGAVVAVHLLAFHEPLEYRASERWLADFNGKSKMDRLAVGGDIAAVTGSTLTSNAVAASVRRALAIHAVVFKAE